MKRREFIARTGAVATRPLVARAQQPERMRRVLGDLGRLWEVEGADRRSAPLTYVRERKSNSGAPAP